MTVLIAFREDLTAEMLEYDLPPAEAASVMVDEIGGEHIRAVFDITSGTPVFVMEEDPWHYLRRMKDGERSPPNGLVVKIVHEPMEDFGRQRPLPAHVAYGHEELRARPLKPPAVLFPRADVLCEDYGALREVLPHELVIGVAVALVFLAHSDHQSISLHLSSLTSRMA